MSETQSIARASASRHLRRRSRKARAKAVKNAQPAKKAGRANKAARQTEKGSRSSVTELFTRPIFVEIQRKRYLWRDVLQQRKPQGCGGWTFPYSYLMELWFFPALPPVSMSISWRRGSPLVFEIQI